MQAKTYPVVTSQLSAMGAAVVCMPWIMAGINALAAQWSVALPDTYESQLTALISGVFSVTAAAWAHRRVLSPTMTLPGYPE